ncbi:MAG: creatininase family protein, partial [Bacillota bacterium]|nr:creatininase family protein [Bacillota bacterium]
IRRFVFINGHGGNVAALTVVLAKIKYACPDAQLAFASPWFAQEVIKDKVTSAITGHACEIEMSMCMYLAERAVKTGSLTKGALKITPEEYRNPHGIVIAKSWDENTENGALGDATRASREIGEAAVEAAIEKIARFIEEFTQR